MIRNGNEKQTGRLPWVVGAPQREYGRLVWGWRVYDLDAYRVNGTGYVTPWRADLTDAQDDYRAYVAHEPCLCGEYAPHRCELA